MRMPTASGTATSEAGNRRTAAPSHRHTAAQPPPHRTDTPPPHIRKFKKVTIELIVIGKTDSKEVAALVEQYARRIDFYCRFRFTVLPDVRNTRSLSEKQQRTAEGEAILRQLTEGDYVALLDEHGTEYRSVEFAAWLQKRMNSGMKRLVLVIGGPYGFSEAVYARADARLSLSKMTFSHQIVRALFAEQLYRAFTILNNEPYHHE